MIKIKRTGSTNTAFQNLVALLDADLKIRDGEDHLFYAQFNHIEMIKHVLVAYNDHQPIACGGFKKYDETTVEIKRMFVHSNHRGLGIGQQVLLGLEEWAVELGYTSCILETGIKQPEAIRLYEKTGYSRISNYGQYENIANSICMRKTLISDL